MIHHCTFSHHKITFKGKKSEKVAIVKAHIGSLLYNSMERQKLRQPPSTMLQQQVILSLSEVETESQSDVIDRVDRVVAEALANRHRRLILYQNPVRKHYPRPSKYGRKRSRVDRDDYVSREKTVF